MLNGGYHQLAGDIYHITTKPGNKISRPWQCTDHIAQLVFGEIILEKKQGQIDKRSS